MHLPAQTVTRYGRSPQRQLWTAPIIPDAGYQLAIPESGTDPGGSPSGVGLTVTVAEGEVGGMSRPGPIPP